MAHGHADAPELTRHLALVHDTLEFKGWAGVRALPAGVLRRALGQAQKLAQDEPSPAISMLQERLQAFNAAREAPEVTPSPASSAPSAAGPALEVVEISFAEFEKTERGRFRTAPGR